MSFLLSVFGSEMTPETVQTNSGSVPMLPVTGLQPATTWVCFCMSESVNDFVSQSRPQCSSVALSVTQVTCRTDPSVAQEVIKQSTNSLSLSLSLSLSFSLTYTHTHTPHDSTVWLWLYWDPGRSNNRNRTGSTFPAVLSEDFYYSKHFTLHYQNTVFAI